MTILLTVLKVIGIILLILLALLLFLILLVLFFPVGYSVCGVSEEDVSVKGKVYWLFSALSFRFAYEKSELSTEIRIFGFRLKKREEDSFPEDEDFSENDSFSGDGDFSEDKSLERDETPVSVDEREEAKEALEEAVRADEREKVKEDSKEEPPRADEQEKAEEALNENPKEEPGHKSSARKKKASADTSGRESERKKPGSFLKRGKELWHTITQEENKATAKSALGELIYLLKHFRVRKIQSELTFSAGDPALTGQVLGVLCLIPFLYQKGVHMTPDFEAEKWYVRGGINGTGHMRLVHVLRSLIRLWKDENIRKLIKNR